MLHQPILNPAPTEKELMIEPKRYVTQARENFRENQTEIRHKENYKRDLSRVCRQSEPFDEPYGFN